jgi:hypothetical protein
MREGTWFTGHWYKTCMKCDLSIGEEDASYCPNCGKWLGSVRQHVVAFFLFAVVAFVVAIGMALIAYINDGAIVHSILATVFGGLCLGILSAIKPFGSYLVRSEEKKRRAEEWNDEVERRKWTEEDLEERKHSANWKADSDLDIKINVMNAEAVQEALLKSRDRIAAMMKEVASNPDAEKPDDEKRDVLRLILEKVEALRDRTEELMERAARLEEAPLGSDGVTTLPVRNGPALTVYYPYTKDNIEGANDIKRNLEKAYESHCNLAGMRVRLRGIVHSWERFRPGCADGPMGPEKCTNCDKDETAFCEKINETRLILEEKQQPITFTTVSKGLDRFTDIGCSCGRTNRVIHLRQEFTCPCGKRYVSTVDGWRSEPRCRLRYGSVACCGPYGETVTGSCDKTTQDCVANRNFERFSP